MAAMEAYNHLTEWKSLQYCSTVCIDESSPPDLEKMWSEPLYQVKVTVWDTHAEQTQHALYKYGLNNASICRFGSFMSMVLLHLHQELYLHHMIRSMLKQLQLGERDQTLLSFIDNAMRVDDRKKLLESHYSQELSLLYILQEDYDRARYYTNYALQLFMEVWLYINRLLKSFLLLISCNAVLSRNIWWIRKHVL